MYNSTFLSALFAIVFAATSAAVGIVSDIRAITVWSVISNRLFPSNLVVAGSRSIGMVIPPPCIRSTTSTSEVVEADFSALNRTSSS